MIKLLLLGSGNSGKSTVMKQFKIIHKRGFTTEERRVFRDALWKSAIEGMRALVRTRQDYISATHLGDPDFDTYDDEERQREQEMLDPSLEPYLQFLLFRVRNDQPLYEEVIIPVAADPNPRGECFSPPKVESKQASSATSLGDSTALPLLTSTTIVLSSPPVTERKSALDGEFVPEGEEEIGDGPIREPHDHAFDVLPPASLDGIGGRSSTSSVDGGTQPSSGATELHRAGDNRTPTSSELGVPPKRNKKKKSKNASMSPAQPQQDDDRGEIGDHVDELPPMAPRESKSATSTVPEMVDHSQSSDAAAGSGCGSDESNQKQSPVIETIEDFSGGENEELDEDDFDEQVVVGDQILKKSSKKRTFASPEEEAAYMAKQERRRRKKKKKEKLKQKQMDDFDVPGRSTGGGGGAGGGAKKMFSGSSVESFRSDISRNNMNQKVTAPMVTWEKMTIGRLLEKIWMDPLIQRAWAMEEKSPQLEAPMAYIMNAIDRIADPGFQPRNEDILFARKRTSGVNLLEFEAYGAKFLLIDVGGQRTERKKWLAHFNIVHAVIFVVGLDQYDQVMMEDGVTNRLRDSLDLFEEICSSPWFRNSSFLLFLNKSDVFRSKIRQVPITVCFRGYTGDPHDYEQASKYIIKRFQQIHSLHANNYRDAQPQMRGRKNSAHQATPHVYPYITNATDTESMRFVIDTCQDILLRSEMARWGFFDF